MVRIKRLEIKGFRAFGAQPQMLDFSGPMAVVWGPNSQGKTSLAEAIEFLLTGKTVRRELVASAKREFAEALRNAHLPLSEDVVVAAEIEDAQGQVHRIERRLIRDYTGRDPCQSELTIDGNLADDLTCIGIRLSQPPLEASVLMPHTLRYVVSADPQQRTEYFKAILEVSDLEEIRGAIVDAKNQLVEPISDVSPVYERCRSNPQFGHKLALLETESPSRKLVENLLSEALEQILSGHSQVPPGLDARVSLAKELLKRQREQTFPLDDLALRSEPSWEARPDVRRPLEAFLRAKTAVDKEVTRLLSLFEEVLKIPDITSATKPIDCPVCGTPQALTPERINAIRQKVESNKQFTKHRQCAENVLHDLTVLAQRLLTEAKDACPSAMNWQTQDWSRHEPAIAELLGDRAAGIMTPWREALSDLATALGSLQDKAIALQNTVRSPRLDDLDEAKIGELGQEVNDLFQSAEHFRNALGRYQKAVEPLLAALKQEIDRRAGTEGWQDLIDLIVQREKFLQWLIERAAYREILKEVDQAIGEIDRAKAEILDDKFAELSQEIARWWNLLRPDEPTSFHGLVRAGTGRRFIDLKARLATADPSASQSVLRDAVAVFSDSQLNCLGLAAFLARTVREGTGFVILDDPVSASDEEHRAFFIDRVLDALIQSGIQVILLTHDERMWKEVLERYSHLDLNTFIVKLEDPAKGTAVEERSDTLDAMLARATLYVGNPNPEIRKIAARILRDAAERFCKLMLVKDRRDKGDSSASLSDYDGRTLGELEPKVQPLLTKDPSHIGKLRVIRQRLNPGSHDDRLPPPGDLKQCLGELRALRKEYLP
ncbi:MAG TPA: AAA family ATPase [Firmicutes bacterium]|nr:AAA family ATPase [Candidatus Fermentithermobacillaceae bacterium]